jgi:hypothetical protein
MSIPNLEEEIYEHLQQLPVEQQRQVLGFVRALAATRVRGVPGQALLRFAGAIDASDLTTMAQAIEEGCEHIHAEDW